MTDMSAIAEQLARIARLLEQSLPQRSELALEEGAIAHLWEYRQGQPRLMPVREPALIAFDDLRNVDRQKALIEQNTRQFVAGRPANNVLLTGARGTGKSSLVKACLHAFQAEGLRLIELDKEHLADLPLIIDLLRNRPERFILFCDDLSFEDGETGYKGLKTVLDGSVAGQSGNVLIYATSNRRHLLAERAEDNLAFQRSESGELHPGEAVEEKVSLSERFGLWISFYAFSQEQYLEAVARWLESHGLGGVEQLEWEQAAIRWATHRGSRSGRIAAQFARDYAGRRP
ncbi:ATP-binding protein [Pseudomonas nitroreducens]|uniref:ATP-binding protein n=1 Tax=Pseudomonas nitroreducens TaxID=46680 RepID=UPI002F358EE7